MSKEYIILYVVNASYTAGVIPADMRDLYAVFLTMSAHKSMASLGFLGFLITSGI